MRTDLLATPDEAGDAVGAPLVAFHLAVPAAVLGLVSKVIFVGPAIQGRRMRENADCGGEVQVAAPDASVGTVC